LDDELIHKLTRKKDETEDEKRERKNLIK